MNIRINGQDRAIPQEQSLADLVRDLELEGRPIAVELNQNIVPKRRYGEIRLKEGDRLEVVSLVGGG